MIRRIQYQLATLLIATALLPIVSSTMAQERMPVLVKGVLKTVPANPEEAELFTGPRALHDLADEAEAWEPNLSLIHI